MTPDPRFDQLAGSYDDLLKDPIRDRFRGQQSLFFHLRKRDLIRDFFHRRGMIPGNLVYLDLGCGKGELLDLLKSDFRHVAGCDVSNGMLATVPPGIETRMQEDPLKIPFSSSTFDFITAVCVFHHVPPDARLALTQEIQRVLKPSGIFCLIEHNPFNPVTRLIVSRTPVDDDAILLRPSEARCRNLSAGFTLLEQRYFLFLPEKLYSRFAGIEGALCRVPLGGQYTLFATKPGA